MKPKFNPFLRSALLTAAVVLCGTAVHAQTNYTWNGTTSTDWATGSNWTGSVVGGTNGTFNARLNVYSGTNQTLTYSSAQGTTVYANSAGRGLVIGNTGFAAGSMIITGGTLSTLGSTQGDVIGNVLDGTLTVSGGSFIGTDAGTGVGINATSGTSILTVSGSGSATVATLTLGALSSVVNLNTGGTLAANSISSGTGTSTFNFNGGTLVARTGTNAFMNGLTKAYVLSGGAKIDTNGNDITIGQALLTGTANDGGLTKSGSGTLKLSSDGMGTNPKNTFTGGTVINGGTLEIFGRSADNGGYTSLGTGAVTINNGGTLVAANDWALGNEWNVGNVGTVTVNAGGTLTLNTAGNTIRNGLVLNGATVNGSGVNNDWGGLYLRNTYVTVGGSATSSISVDTALNATTTMTVGAGSQLNYSGKIHNKIGATGGITKEGTGTLTLSGSNSYSGVTDIKAGTLVADNGTALGTGGWSGSTMTWVRDGATLALQGNISLDEHMHVTGTGVGGLGAIRSLSGNNALTMTNNNSGSGPGLAIDGNTTIGVDADTLTLTGFYHDSGSYGITKVGNGTLKLTQGSTYTGDTTISAGTLQIGNGGAGGSLYSPSVSSGNLTFGSAGAIVNNGALVYNIAGGSVNVNKTISGTGSLSVTGDRSVNFAAGTSIRTTGSQTYTATATSGRFYGFNLADNATVTLTSTAGNISMTGMLGTANGNTGNLAINTSAGNGSVTLNTAVGVSGVDYGINSLTVNAGTGTITLGTHNGQNWGTVNTVSLTGGAINSTANMAGFTTLTVTNSAASAFSGNLTASGGSLVKNGGGVLTLTGSNSYTGSTTVGAGTLVLSGNNTIGAVNVNGGSVLFSGGNSTINGNINLNVEGGSGLSFTGGVVTMNQLNFAVTGNPGEAFTISGTAEVHANGGVISQSWRGSSGMFLNGGTLLTPWIASNSSTTSWLNDRAYIHFNGTKIVATANQADFIQLAGGANYGNENFAKLNATTTFDTAGYGIGIGVEFRVPAA